MRLETVDTNLTGDQSQPLERTGLPAITRALRRSSETDVLVVDLREGSTWWEGRLFILLAGAAYRDRPRAIAFVADLNGKRQQFIGWGSPRRLVDLHARKVPAFARALATASARIRQWEAGDPVFAPGENDAHIWRAVQIPGGPIMGLPSHPDDLTDPRYAFELFLAAAIDPAREPLVRLVTRARLMELYDSSLVTDNVPVGASDRDWASVLRGRRDSSPSLPTGDSNLSSPETPSSPRSCPGWSKQANTPSRKWPAEGSAQGHANSATTLSIQYVLRPPQDPRDRLACGERCGSPTGLGHGGPFRQAILFNAALAPLWCDRLPNQLGHIQHDLGARLARVIRGPHLADAYAHHFVNRRCLGWSLTCSIEPTIWRAPAGYARPKP